MGGARTWGRPEARSYCCKCSPLPAAAASPIGPTKALRRCRRLGLGRRGVVWWRRVSRAIQGYAFDVGEVTDAGLHPDKQVNEDLLGKSATKYGSLFVVCDGMGGHAGGQLASRTAVAILCDEVERSPEGLVPRDVLATAIQRAARAVFEVGSEEAQLRPGSTLVAVLVHTRGAEVAHVGDSRAYLLRQGQIARLTQDHSVVRVMVERGEITEEEAVDHPDANQITRALGMAAEVEAELRPEPLVLMAGDVLMLCTDGLTDLATDDEIRQILETHLQTSTDRAATQLVEVAKMRGGHDNVTVQVIKIESTPKETAAKAAAEAAAAQPHLVLDERNVPRVEIPDEGPNWTAIVLTLLALATGVLILVFILGGGSGSK